MPTYDYECTKCGNTFELFHKIDDSPKKTCPKCKAKVRRLISGGCGLIFKGSGFYSTDYKKKSPPEQKSSEKGQSQPCNQGQCSTNCSKNNE